MNKLDMAHDYMVAWMQSGNSEIIDANELASFFFSVADAMQAEADKREPKGFPEVLQPEVDWRLCPSDEFTHWIQPSNGLAFWYSELNASIAPSFGFTGSHIAERPHD